MTRPLPEGMKEPPQAEVKQDSATITQIRNYRLITPLFGGGVEPGKADPITIIRGSEIRGQLRFWWRATRGGRFGGDPVLMKQAEELLWGAPSTKEHARPSMVQITVEVSSKGCEDRPYSVTRQPNRSPKAQFSTTSVVPAYAAFPLQPDKKSREYGGGMETKAVRVGVNFKLELMWTDKWKTDATPFFRDSPRQEIGAALWAWETFGGIGARTRRGFGALNCVSVTENGRSVARDGWMPSGSSASEVIEWIQEKLNQYIGEHRAWPKGTPHLSATDLAQYLKVVEQEITPTHETTRAWAELMNRCQMERVDQDTGRR